MPLGPLATDDAIGMDHVNNAIGAAFAAYWGCAHVINAVTRQEHTGVQFLQMIRLKQFALLDLPLMPQM